MDFVDTDSLSYLFHFLKKSTGVELTLEKAYLVESRLKPLAEELKIHSLKQLCRKLEDPAQQALRSTVLDALLTHETSFFREPKVFDTLANYLAAPAVIENTGKRVRIWSAACSTGQEPYSLAIHLMEKLPAFSTWDIRIIATDIAEEQLQTASAGIYSNLQTNRGMPTGLLIKHFTQHERSWKLSPEVKKSVSFSRSNLMWEVPSGGPFDIILCRNVFIYFDETTRGEIIRRIRKYLKLDGLLVIGASENLIGRSEGFEPFPCAMPGIFKAVPS